MTAHAHTAAPATTVAPAPAPLPYTHEAMIDLILAEPSVTSKELATLFGYSAAWVSRILASDSFQARLAARKAALIDPSITRRLDERFRAIAVQSTEVLQQRLDAEESASLAMDALAVATSAMRAVRGAVK